VLLSLAHSVTMKMIICRTDWRQFGKTSLINARAKVFNSCQVLTLQYWKTSQHGKAMNHSKNNVHKYLINNLVSVEDRLYDL